MDTRRTQPAVRSLALSLSATPLAEVFTSVTVVREVCRPGSEFHNAFLPGLTIFLTEQGEAKAEIGEQTFHHRPGHLIFLKSGMPLREYVGDLASWKVEYMLAAGPWAVALENALTEREPREQRGVSYQPAPLHWQQQFKELLKIAFAQETGWHWAFLSGCATLFGWVVRYAP